LRDSIDRFANAGAQVVCIAPDTTTGVSKFVAGNEYPFPLLADPNHEVFDAYDVISTMMSLGQRPALFVVDRDGIVRFDSVGTQQWQIPSNDNVLALLSSLR
jgi:peroxiredoxin Q/BCP